MYQQEYSNGGMEQNLSDYQFGSIPYPPSTNVPSLNSNATNDYKIPSSSYREPPNPTPSVNNLDVPLLEVQPSLELVLYHKPKGSKGIWKKIEASDKIRVTKGNGKRLKLQLTSLYDFIADSLVLRLIDVDLRTSFSPDKEGGSFYIEGVKANERTMEITLKLFRMGGRLQFYSQLQSTDNAPIGGCSAEFFSYTSGSTRERPATTKASASMASPPPTPASQQQQQQANHSYLSIPQNITLPPQLQHLQQNQQLVMNALQNPEMFNTQSYRNASSSYPNPHLTNQTNQTSQMPTNSHQTSIPNQMPNSMQSSNSIQNSIHSSIQSAIQTASSNPLQPSSNSNMSRSNPYGASTYNSSEIKNEPGLGDNAVTTVPGSLEVHGIARAKAFIQFSDIRLKTNIADLVDAIHLVTSLQGKRYEWKDQGDESKSGARQVIGLIAQEVQRILPEVVHEDAESGLLSVSYTEILPVLIEAFKDFLGRYRNDREDLLGQVSSLQSQLQDLSNELVKTSATHEEVSILIGSNRSKKGAEKTPRKEAKTAEVPSAGSEPIEEELEKKHKRKGLNTLPKLKKKDIPTFCKVLQLVFSTFLAIFMICGIVGIIIAVSNTKDGNIFSVPPEEEVYPSESGSFDNDNPRAHQIIGLTLFEVGAFGTAVSGFGVLSASIFLCLQARYFRKRREGHHSLEMKEMKKAKESTSENTTQSKPEESSNVPDV